MTLAEIQYFISCRSIKYYIGQGADFNFAQTVVERHFCTKNIGRIGREIVKMIFFEKFKIFD